MKAKLVTAAIALIVVMGALYLYDKKKLPFINAGSSSAAA